MASNKTLLIISLLLFAAFLGGVKWTGLKSGQVRPVQNAQDSPGQEGQPQVLGAQDQKDLVEGATVVKGNPEAKITIVEFSDYQCPYCARYVTTTQRQIMDTYGNDIFYVWRDFPLGFHQNASKAALAARAAGEQGKYWEMHDLLFENQADWSEEKDPTQKFSQYAEKLGLDLEKFNRDLNNPDYKAQIQADIDLGRDVEVSATPTFFINGQQISGAESFEEFERIIREKLK